MIFLLGIPTTSNILCSSVCVTLIPAFINASSNISNGLFQILHQPLQTNFTLPYLISPKGINKIDALNFFAKSSVKSKYSLDFAIASCANVSIDKTSLIFGLLRSVTALPTHKLAATIGKAAFLLPEIIISHLSLGEYWI